MLLLLYNYKLSLRIFDFGVFWTILWIDQGSSLEDTDQKHPEVRDHKIIPLSPPSQ